MSCLKAIKNKEFDNKIIHTFLFKVVFHFIMVCQINKLFQDDLDTSSMPYSHGGEGVTSYTGIIQTCRWIGSVF